MLLELVFLLFTGAWPFDLTDLLSPRLVGAVRQEARNYVRSSFSYWALSMAGN